MLKMFVFRWKYPFLNSESERTLHDFTHLFWLGGGFNPFEKYYRVLRIKVPFNIFLCYNDEFVDVHPMVERIFPKLTPKTNRMAFHNEKSCFSHHRITHFIEEISRAIIFTNLPFFWSIQIRSLSTPQAKGQRPDLAGHFRKKKTGWWLNQPPFEKYARQNGWKSSPIFGVNIKYIWDCHHLEKIKTWKSTSKGFTTHQPGWNLRNPHLYHEDVAIPYPNHLPQLLP